VVNGFLNLFFCEIFQRRGFCRARGDTVNTDALFGIRDSFRPRQIHNCGFGGGIGRTVGNSDMGPALRSKNFS